MTTLDNKPKIKLTPTQQPRALGITRLFDGVTDALAQVWEGVRPVAMMILAPVGRALSHSLLMGGREWNPVRLDACYWDVFAERRLSHGLAWSFVLQAVVVLIFTLSLQIPGCDEYLMPAGGGSNRVLAKQMAIPKVKVKKRRYVVNPNSPIKFVVPDIDQMMEQKVTMQLEAASAHVYGVGQLGSGTGEGAGYKGGKGAGMVRLIRLKYSGGDWNSNFGKGADNNMLTEYAVRSQQKTASESEAITIDHLGSYKQYRSPPLVYITGSGNMNVDDRDAAVLRTYLTKQHGMLFADAASPNWGRNFRSFMSRVLPDVKPVYITVDDPIMKMPYTLPSMPYASPHDPPMELTGWKVGGRWVAIYHPGDIGDCWKDGHSGVSAETASAAYALGVNIIHYAHAQYSEWVEANAPGGKQ